MKQYVLTSHSLINILSEYCRRKFTFLQTANSGTYKIVDTEFGTLCEMNSWDVTRMHSDMSYMLEHVRLETEVSLSYWQDKQTIVWC